MKKNMTDGLIQFDFWGIPKLSKKELLENNDDFINEKIDDRPFCQWFLDAKAGKLGLTTLNCK